MSALRIISEKDPQKGIESQKAFFLSNTGSWCKPLDVHRTVHDEHRTAHRYLESTRTYEIYKKEALFLGVEAHLIKLCHVSLLKGGG